MRKAFENKLNIILVGVLAVLAVVIVVAVNFVDNKPKTNNTPVYTAPVTTTEKATTAPPEVTAQEEIATISNTKATKATQRVEPTESTESTEETENTEESSSPYATAATEKNKASYKKQWDAGYLLALDYPDTSYRCPHVELSEENRALIESICMGEFGAGGFNGAALIAQSIKNGMVYFNTDDVNAVIQKLKFSGRKNTNPSKDVKDAVVYIFDMDKNAVQHRILYKYNPTMTGEPSEFHESKEYVCTYRDARFFDE